MCLGRSLGIETGHPLVRAGGGRTPGRVDSSARSTRPRTDRAGAQGPYHRGFWRRRDLRRADRQVLRRRGEWRVQHEERGDGPIARRGLRHRLYTQEDFTQSGQKYDLIFQLAGTLSPSECRRALTSKGTLVISSGESEGRWIGPVDRVIKALVLSGFVSQKMASFTVKPNKEDLQFLKQLIEAGTLTPVIDRTYPLSGVPEAIRYLEGGHAQGKVVITI